METVVTTTIAVSQPAVLGVGILAILFVGFVALAYIKAKMSASAARENSAQRESEMLMWAYQQAAINRKAQESADLNPIKSAA